MEYDIDTTKEPWLSLLDGEDVSDETKELVRIFVSEHNARTPEQRDIYLEGIVETLKSR